MTYDDAVLYFHSLEKFGINPGLERITVLCEALGNPQDKLKFIHVAGTNGKGSTSTMLSEIMQAAGYKTGLFTSPYVIDFCERMQIDGKMISHSDLADIVTDIEPVISALGKKGIQVTEFEAITAAAFLYFIRNDCDIVVLEVGLGGRFDSTNIIKTPLASVITSISLDHMAVLGDTIEKIAVEKCGIIKLNGITVSYPKQATEAIAAIRKTAKLRKNELFLPELKNIKIVGDSIWGTKTTIEGLQVFIPLMGRHMVLNAAVAVKTAQVLTERGLVSVTGQNIITGINNIKMPARMEILCENPMTILDGGHNEGCAKALADAIKKYLKNRRIIAVCGMMSDKDYDGFLKTTAPLFDSIIATKPNIPRALQTRILADHAKMYCVNSFTEEDSTDAFHQAVTLVKKDGVILVCGSFYLASELRAYMINYFNQSFENENN